MFCRQNRSNTGQTLQEEPSATVLKVEPPVPPSATVPKVEQEVPPGHGRVDQREARGKRNIFSHPSRLQVSVHHPHAGRESRQTSESICCCSRPQLNSTHGTKQNKNLHQHARPVIGSSMCVCACVFTGSSVSYLYTPVCVCVCYLPSHLGRAGESPCYHAGFISG